MAKAPDRYDQVAMMCESNPGVFRDPPGPVDHPPACLMEPLGRIEGKLDRVLARQPQPYRAKGPAIPQLGIPEFSIVLKGDEYPEGS